MAKKTKKRKAKKKTVVGRACTAEVQSDRKFSMETQEISDFFSFMEFVMYELPKRYWFIDTIFRGQADIDWHPEPKLDRPDFERWRAEVGGKRQEHESALLRDFKRIARPHLTFHPRDEWEWLAIGQHHGLCTRLLDWTRNPLVALYFAAEDVECSKDGAVWCYFHLGDTTENAKDPFASDSVVLFEPPHISPRITTQMSCLTAHPCGGEPTAERWRGRLVKIVVPAHMKASMKESVNALGINRASLFPDLDGIATHTNRTFLKREWEEYL